MFGCYFVRGSLVRIYLMSLVKISLDYLDIYLSYFDAYFCYLPSLISLFDYFLDFLGPLLILSSFKT